MEGNRKKYLIFGSAFIILGFAGLFMPAGYELFSEDTLPLQETAMAQMPTFQDQFVDPAATFPIAADRSPKPAPDYDLTDVKDRLIIAKGKINMPVFLGDTEKVLNKGGWLFPTTSRPDLGGNSVIFGHRYKFLPPISNTLYNLDKVEIGDELVLVWQGKEYKYKVFEKKIVEPTDLSVIQPTQEARLTVITCTPIFTTKQRLVVTGALVKN